MSPESNLSADHDPRDPSQMRSWETAHIDPFVLSLNPRHRATVTPVSQEKRHSAFVGWGEQAV
jgi:hypothetical protein